MTPPYVDTAGASHVGFEVAIPRDPINPGLVAFGAILVGLGLISIASGARPSSSTAPTRAAAVALPALAASSSAWSAYPY
jgi:hypothetical protein